MVKLLTGIVTLLGFRALTGYWPVGYVREVLRLLRGGEDPVVDSARRQVGLSFDVLAEEDPTKQAGKRFPTDRSFAELNEERGLNCPDLWPDAQEHRDGFESLERAVGNLSKVMRSGEPVTVEDLGKAVEEGL